MLRVGCARVAATGVVFCLQSVYGEYFPIELDFLFGG